MKSTCRTIAPCWSSGGRAAGDLPSNLFLAAHEHPLLRARQKLDHTRLASQGRVLPSHDAADPGRPGKPIRAQCCIPSPAPLFWQA
jgi:hypothetical protein